MELKIFSRYLEFQGIVEEFSSLIWTRRYYQSGEFQLVCSATTDNLNLLKKGNIIWKQDDEEAGYIYYRQFIDNDDGSESIIVKGNFLTKYIGRRIINCNEVITETPEQVILTLINNHVVNPSDLERKIDNIIVSITSLSKEKIKYQRSYSNVLEEIQSLAETYQLGYKIRFNIEDKRLEFEVYKGKDVSVKQNENSPVIFSKEFDNVLSQTFTESDDNYKNVNYVAGEGEGENRKKIIVGEGTGLDRFETFTDARDIQTFKTNSDGEQIEISEEDIIAMLQQRGIQKLSELKKTQAIVSTINLNSNYIYKEDFNLGDVVTCLSEEWGVELDVRITEITEVYEETGRRVDVTFGDEVLTFIERIRNKLR